MVCIFGARLLIYELEDEAIPSFRRFGYIINISIIPRHAYATIHTAICLLRPSQVIECAYINSIFFLRQIA